MCSEVIPLHFYDVQAKDLIDILNEDGWLIDSVSNQILMIL